MQHSLNWGDAALTSLPMGLIYGIATIGFSLVYRHLKFPDFTTISSITIGGITCVVFSNYSGFWEFGLFCSIVIGGLLGLCTGLQITYFKIPAILAGITSSVGAISLAFRINDNNADVNFKQHIPEWLGGTVFNWGCFTVGFFELLFVAYIISSIFKTRFGDYILALHGTRSYVDHRHHCVVGTKNSLIALSNAIISFAGGLAAIQNNGATVENHKDFLLLALAGYSLGTLLIFTVNKITKIDSEKDGDSLSKILKLPTIPRLYKWFVNIATKNDEEPIKMFITFISYAVSTVFVNMIFHIINVNSPEKNNGYFLKASVLFFFLWWASSIKKNNNQESE